MSTNLNEQVKTFLQQRTASLVAAVVAIVLLGAIANQCLAIYHAASFQPVVENENSITPSKTVADYSASTITDSNLFGRYVINADMLQQTNLPTTSLQVYLRGVFTSSNPRQASAIIERPDGSVRTYKVNSVVFGGTRLHAVFNDRIVLSNNGELETLYFPQPGAEDNPTTTENVSAITLDQVPQGVRDLVENNMTPEEIRQASKELSSPTMTPEQRAELIRERLMILRNRARENNK